MSETTKTGRYRIRHKEYFEELEQYRQYYREIAEYIAPRRGRYLKSTKSETNDGTKKHSLILNGTGTVAVRVIASGMHSGLTSPVRPWIRFGLLDRELMNFKPVKDWLHMVRDGMLEVYSRSNFYPSMHALYREVVPFGTACELTEESFSRIIRCRPFTVGEYALGLNEEYVPDILHRQFNLNAHQMVEKYGKDNVSEEVKRAFEEDLIGQRFEIVHIVEPNKSVDGTKKDFRGMPYKSISYEVNGDPDTFLEERGYKSKPHVGIRWDVVGVDTYGSECPGFDAHGDNKMLQKVEEKKLKGLDKQIDPPMVAPTAMKGKGGTIISGGVSFVDVQQGQQGFQPAYQVNLDFRNVAHEIDRIERRIEKFYFNDLFLMIANEDRSGVTATEIARKYEEKLILLGPITERIHDEGLNYKIARTFQIMDDLGMIPPAPKEMEGQPIKIEYISTLAQAQKMVGLTGIERVAGFVGGLAQINPAVADKFNYDEAVDDYADNMGINPKLIRSDKETEVIRDQRAEQEAAAQRQAMAIEGAKAAKTLSDTELDKNSALDGIRESLQ